MKINDLIATLIKSRATLKGDDINIVIWADKAYNNFEIKLDEANNDLIIDILALPNERTEDELNPGFKLGEII